MKKFIISLLIMLLTVSGFSVVKSSLFANFSTGIFQNIDDQFLKQKPGPFNYGERFGDNRVYLGESAFSVLLNLSLKEGDDFVGNASFYVNKYYSGSPIIDVNNVIFDYISDNLVVKGFFKARAFKFKNIPSDTLFSFMTSFDVLSATYNKAIAVYPYFIYPIVYSDGDVVNLPTANEDTTNLGLQGRDYYGIYASYYDGLVEMESYFAKNIYGGTILNSSFSNLSISGTNYIDGSFYGSKVGGASDIGVGELHIGMLYRAIVGNSTGYILGNEYRNVLFIYNYVAWGANSSNRVEQYGGYLSLSLVDLITLNADGGVINTYWSSSSVAYGDYYYAASLLLSFEGMKFEFTGVGIIPSTNTSIGVTGLESKGTGSYYVPLLTDEDVFTYAIKGGIRQYKVDSTRYDNTSIFVLISSVYNFGDFEISLFGYGDNANFYIASPVETATNVFYGDIRFYLGYDLSNLEKAFNGMSVKAGIVNFIQKGFVSVDRENYLTPYIGFWYNVPKADMLITLSYGYYGARSEFDLDFGRGLESEILLYNGVGNYNSGLFYTDFISFSTNNLGLYKLTVDPVIRFDVYIKI